MRGQNDKTICKNQGDFSSSCGFFNLPLCAFTADQENRATVLIASSEKKFRIVKGNFKGNIVLAFRALPGKRPDLAKFWTANLFLRTKGSDQFEHALSLTANPPYEADRDKPFNPSDYGNIK